MNPGQTSMPDDEGNLPTECELIADDTVSVRVYDVTEAHHLAATLRAEGSWEEVVPGLGSVAVMFDPLMLDKEEALLQVRKAIETQSGAIVQGPKTVTIPVSYGGNMGPDLEAVSWLLGLSTDDFIGLHTAHRHTVEMIGFAPGFASIGGFGAAADVRRLERPRMRDQAGAVGVVGGRTGLYALSGPGGWPIVGRTDVRLFDPSKEEPFLLSPGDRIQFQAV